MSKSDIFDAYAKLAVEKGIIKTAEDPKKTLEKNPRADSLSLKDISNLYNVKNDKPKDMEYTRNIIEDAHPERVVLFRAHDKINALVENNNERQDIIINILRKTPNGSITYKKYAESELTMSLIRVANEMDNLDWEELRILADTCTEQLKEKSIKKTAIAPALIGAVAVAGGLLYLKNHTDYNNRGVLINGQNLVEQLEDIITSGTGAVTLRTEYRDELKDQLRHVQKEVEKVINAYSKMSTVLDNLEAPRTSSELNHILQTAQAVSTRPAVMALYNNFKALVKNLEPMLTQIVKNFKSESYKQKETKEEGLGGKINDFFGGVFYGGKGLIADDFDDVVHAINPFRSSLKEVLQQISNAEFAEDNAKQQLAAAEQNAMNYEDSKETENNEAIPANFSFDDVAKEIEEFNKIYSK